MNILYIIFILLLILLILTAINITIVCINQNMKIGGETIPPTYTLQRPTSTQPPTAVQQIPTVVQAQTQIRDMTNADEDDLYGPSSPITSSSTQAAYPVVQTHTVYPPVKRASK